MDARYTCGKARSAYRKHSGMTTRKSHALPLAARADAVGEHSLSESKIECRTFIRRGFGPDAAAMPLDDALHNRQPNAGAFLIFGSMQALEHAEQFTRVLHVEANAIVAHEIHNSAVHQFEADFNLGGRLFAGVLDGVG